MVISEKRWMRRFSCYLGVLQHLENFVAIGKTRVRSVAEEFAVIKAFELTFECAWNVINDFLQGRGYSQIYGPRDAIRFAVRAGLIKDGEIWFDIMAKCGNAAHAYDEETVRKMSCVVSDEYMKEFRHLKTSFERLKGAE